MFLDALVVGSANPARGKTQRLEKRRESSGDAAVWRDVPIALRDPKISVVRDSAASAGRDEGWDPLPSSGPFGYLRSEAGCRLPRR